MSAGADRYARQKSLAGVGELGQARIGRSEVHIPRGPAAAFELAYLVRAGVERGVLGGPRSRRFPHAEAFVFSGPRRLAEGAEGALGSLTLILGKDD
jgi:hypothetical protein